MKEDNEKRVRQKIPEKKPTSMRVRSVAILLWGESSQRRRS